MIHVVTIENQHLYGPQLDEMFRMRHTFYVEQQEWVDLTSENGREIDVFDNDEAIYLLYLDPFGQVGASYRLNPTTGPNLLASQLSDYVDGPAPNSSKIWDITRWIIAERYRKSANPDQVRQASKELTCGLMEFGVSRGLDAFSTVTETAFIPRLAEADWRFKPLGPARLYEDGKGEAQAILIEAGPEALIRTRAALGMASSVLFEIVPKPVLLSESQLTAEAEEADIAEAIEAVGRSNAQMIVQSLADELAQKAKADPASAVALIQHFNATLSERLSQAQPRPQRTAPHKDVKNAQSIAQAS